MKTLLKAGTSSSRSVSPWLSPCLSYPQPVWSVSILWHACNFNVGKSPCAASNKYLNTFEKCLLYSFFMYGTLITSRWKYPNLTCVVVIMTFECEKKKGVWFVPNINRRGINKTFTFRILLPLLSAQSELLFIPGDAENRSSPCFTFTVSSFLHVASE